MAKVVAAHQSQPQFAEALWAQLMEPPIEIYLKYLNNDTSDAQ